MEIIDKVPESRRDPVWQALRIQILERFRPQIEAAIDVSLQSGRALADTVVFVASPDMAEAGKLPFDAIFDEPAFYVIAGDREGFGAYLKKTYPPARPDSIAFFDNPPPQHYVYVVVGTLGGFTSTALGEFIVTNAPGASGASS
jgi:hypothetical protein